MQFVGFMRFPVSLSHKFYLSTYKVGDTYVTEMKHRIREYRSEIKAVSNPSQNFNESTIVVISKDSMNSSLQVLVFSLLRCWTPAPDQSLDFIFIHHLLMFQHLKKAEDIRNLG